MSSMLPSISPELARIAPGFRALSISSDSRCAGRRNRAKRGLSGRN